MANNRMYLCYRPSGRIIPLAKHMGAGWYRGSGSDKIGNDLDEFYDRCFDDALENNTNQEDFCLLMESSVSKYVDEDWQYDKDKDGKWAFVVFEDKKQKVRNKTTEKTKDNYTFDIGDEKGFAIKLKCKDCGGITFYLGESELYTFLKCTNNNCRKEGVFIE